MNKTISDTEAIIVIIVFVILVGGVMAWQFLWVPKEEARIAEESAEEYMRWAEEEVAKAEAESLLIKESNGVTTLRISFFENAIKFAREATNLDPDNPELWFRRGNVYFGFKEWAEESEKWALICYKEALELDPENQLYREKVKELSEE